MPDAASPRRAPDAASPSRVPFTASPRRVPDGASPRRAPDGASPRRVPDGASPTTRRRPASPGELALVLHTHMPYVEGGTEWPPPDPEAHLRRPDGFGTWPFGEEWLWEAVATSYVPLLEVLEAAGEAVPLTLSLTPVLCDQLEAPGAVGRCLEFLDEIRRESHALDTAHYRAQRDEGVVEALEYSAARYAAAAERLRDGPGMLAGLGRFASWTSAATHAVLPLLASDPALALQVQTGIAAHRRRFGDWSGGFWLPECAYAPWLDEALEAGGVRSTCLELTSVFGLGDRRHLRPLTTAAGAVFWPVDRQTVALVWSDQGYPSHPAYRSSHALTPHRHQAWRNDGAVYDPAAAEATAAAHAAEFVAAVKQRVEGGGICVCALDTELLGHWWHEGVRWLAGVVEEASRQDLSLVTLDDALERHDPAPAPHDLGVSSWGKGGDLRTWSGPMAGDLAWQARSAELRVLALGRRPPDRVLRELLALQSSDWAFQVAEASAGDYPRERAQAHADALEAALDGDRQLEAALRNLAPELVGWG